MITSQQIILRSRMINKINVLETFSELENINNILIYIVSLEILFHGLLKILYFKK